MPLVIRELHRAPSADALNEEWLVLENTGPQPVTAHGCSLSVARNPKERPKILGTIDPGFVLKPGDKIRLVTGTASKKAQGTPPAETAELKNYHLFLKEQVLRSPGAIVRLSLKQLELARGTYQPDAPGGVAAS
jgi:hypothetical protein